MFIIGTYNETERVDMKEKSKDVKKTFLLSFPVELIDHIDKRAAARYATRTQYIKEAVVMRLNGESLTTHPPDYNAMRRANLHKFIRETIKYEEFEDDVR